MSFPIKIAFNGELRRFLSTSAPSYVDVVAAVQQMFPRLGASGFSLKYEDEENELITVASELELAEAVAVCKHLDRKTLKLIVVSRDEDWVSVAPEQAQEKPEQLKEPVIEQPVVEEPVEQPVPIVQEPVPEPMPEPVPEPEPEPEPVEESKDKAPEPNERELTKEELLAALVELASDEQVQAGIPKLAETALSDASLEALVDPSLPTVELLRNILSAVPDIAAHPQVGRLLAAVANVKTECLTHIREHIVSRVVPMVRMFRPMVLEALPALVQQLPVLLQGFIERMQQWEGCQGEARAFMPCFLGGQFPFPPPFGGFPFPPPFPFPSEEQAEEEPQAQGKEAVHRGITCDGCGVNPIVGVRYQCTVCPNFDLCKSCEAKGEHAPTHPMLQLRGSPNAGEAVHQNIQCNNCGVVPIRGARFKCTVCHDFDLCDACEQKGEHSHPMLKMRQPAPCRGRGRHGGHPHPHPWMRHHRAHWGAHWGGPHRAGQAQGEGPCGGFGPLFRMFAARGGGCKRWNKEPAFGSTSACSAFVSDVTLPDGAEIPVGAEMVKTWKFRNDGKEAWPQGTNLVLKRTRGEFETAALPISRLPNPGEEVELSATLKALQPGRGRVVYRLVDNNGIPFGKLWADVVGVAREETKEPAKVEPVKVEPVKPDPVKEPEPVKPEPKTESPKAEERPHKYDQALAALAKMGFEDRKRNIRALNKEKGNLERAVIRLLDNAEGM
jgi:hypothetical protein